MKYTFTCEIKAHKVGTIDIPEEICLDENGDPVDDEVIEDYFYEHYDEVDFETELDDWLPEMNWQFEIE